ncbi:MAG: aminotransferase class III-fold pyridoxal phosphate-dependent enzyme, partial [Leifsonia sp.]
MTDTLASAPASPSAAAYTVPQERRVVTAIPGPKSVEMHKRRLESVSTGVSSTLPVYIKKANGAILVDLDDNQFIDLGAGIGVTTVGHTESNVVEAAT